MLTETEITIVTLLQNPKRTAALTIAALSRRSDLEESINSLHRKGVIHLPESMAEDDPLAYVKLTKFGKLAKLKSPDVTP